MLTRCPHCQTAFRVTSEQLKVRQGRVRCGSCHEVFDALETLADEVSAVVPAAAEIPDTPEAPEEGPALELLPEEASAPSTPVEVVAEPEPAEIPAAAAEEGAPEESRRLQDGATDAGEAQIEPAAAEAAEQEPAVQAAAGESAAVPQPEEAEGVAKVAEPRRWLWLLGIVLLVLLAIGQALFFFRVELAAMAPDLRPALAGACETFGCTLPRPRKPELVGIESSDLAPGGGNRLLLTAMLKNRAPFDQEYPHLELTLTDTRDEPLLRKVLAPADYLPADKPAAAGFAAQGEVAVNLILEAAGVPAIGYRLYLFYP